MNTQAKQELISLIKARIALRELKGGQGEVKLSAGGSTNVYLDIKNVVDDGVNLSILQRAMREHLANHGLEDMTAIGGPDMGALPVALTVANDHYRINETGKAVKWFAVRDHAKTDHGLGKLIEGAELGPKDKVVLTDDVASSGESLLNAYEKILATGAEVVAVIPVVDRSTKARKLFHDYGLFHGPIRYLPIVTHDELGLEAL